MRPYCLILAGLWLCIGLVSCRTSSPSAIIEVDEATAVPTSVAQADVTVAPSPTATQTKTQQPSKTPPATALPPTATPSRTPEPTNTATKRPTSTPTKPVPTETASATLTPQPTSTQTIVPALTPAPIPSNTAVPTITASPTKPPQPTQTQLPSSTPIPTNTATAEPTTPPTQTATPWPTATPIPTVQPTAASTSEPVAELPELMDHIVGSGSAETCTDAALRTAISNGGNIGFACGSEPFTFYLTKPLELTKNTSLFGYKKITFDGSGKSQLIQTAQRLTITIEGITFANGYTTDQGGAINLGFWSNLTIKDSTFTNNRADKDSAMCDGGGAIFIGGGSLANIDGSTFSGNRAQNGGAINNLRSGLRITNSSFYNNTARHSDRINQFGDCGGGGAVYIDGTRKPEDGGPDEIYLRGNRYEGNVTNNHGGALFIAVRTGEKPIVSWSHFERNKAGRHIAIETSGTGGAIWYGTGEGGVSGHYLTMHNNFVGGNHADFQGGGLWTLGPTSVSNSAFIHNVAINPVPLDKDDWRQGNGGAIAVAHQAQVKLNNVTITTNRAGFNGGGVVGENIIAQNSIIANNHGGWHLGLQQNCTHALTDWGNNIQFLVDGDETNITHRSNCGGSIQTVDPMVGAESAVWWSIGRKSPAYNAGNNETCMGNDLRGVSRPQGGTCDIGAFELEE